MLITSIVLPDIAVTMSPGRCARLPGIFSTHGINAVTGIDGFNCAIARIAPIMVAPPAMSYFIFSMPSAGLIEMPPVSNVTPFPTSPRCAFPLSFSGRYRSTTRHGGCALPIATPSSAPIPSSRIRASSSTSQSRPNWSAISRADSATPDGPSLFAGSFTNSRVKFCDSPIIRPRSAAASETRPTTANASIDFLSFAVR